MRTTLHATGLTVSGFLAVVFLVDWEAPLPSVGPSVEPICVETMQRAPDLSWAVRGREEKIGGREIKTVTFGELPFHHRSLVRVAGVLHAEFEWITLRPSFEWVALYPSRAAMERRLSRAPWVALESLWPGDLYWRESTGPSISDRCVLLEGTFSRIPGGHLGAFDGVIHDVLRLDVWSRPHRPFVTEPPPPAEPLR
jgi:hypothetical protein